MLELGQPYSFTADYRDLLDCLFSTGETDIFGRRLRSFKAGRPGGVIRECFISEATCLRHTACLVATVSVWMGDNYPLNLKIPHTDEDGHFWCPQDGQSHFGMAITLDQEKTGDCKASLWLENDPHEWLRPAGRAPTIVDLERQQKPAGKVPQWMSSDPGNLAIKYCLDVWREIIADWDAHCRSMAFEQSAVPTKAQAITYTGGAVPLPTSSVRPLIDNSGTAIMDTPFNEMDSAMPQALRSMERQHSGVAWKREEASPGCVVYHLTHDEHGDIGALWLRQQLKL